MLCTSYSLPMISFEPNPDSISKSNISAVSITIRSAYIYSGQPDASADNESNDIAISWSIVNADLFTWQPHAFANV